jgi:hypothetical protein
MKCVAIYNDDAQCAPRMLELKGRRWPVAIVSRPAASGNALVARGSNVKD